MSPGKGIGVWAACALLALAGATTLGTARASVPAPMLLAAAALADSSKIGPADSAVMAPQTMAAPDSSMAHAPSPPPAPAPAAAPEPAPG